MNKLCQIVNEKDEVIGHKPRNQIDFATDIYRIAALWLVNSSGQVLIAQRKLTKDKDPGKWGPAAAGTLEQGETYESNIYKEAEEEIGIKDIKFELGPKQRFEKPRASFCQWFVAQTDMSEDEFVPQPEEVECVKWVDLPELSDDVERNPDTYVPSMAKILKLLA